MSKLPFNPNDLFKYELDPEKVQLANLVLTMQNNVMLKILISKATEGDSTDFHLKEYESKLAELWARIMPQLDIDNTNDLDI